MLITLERDLETCVPIRPEAIQGSSFCVLTTGEARRTLEALNC